MAGIRELLEEEKDPAKLGVEGGVRGKPGRKLKALNTWGLFGGWDMSKKNRFSGNDVKGISVGVGQEAWLYLISILNLLGNRD